MAKVSYSDHIKKTDVSVILAEIIFQNLKKDHTSLPLFELAETSSGGTPDRANQSYYGGKIPWFKSGELNDSTINMSEEFITEDGLNNSSAKVFPKGTLLVAMYGATAGKTAILDIDAATNQAICAVFPKDKRIRKDFLFWFLRAHRYYYIDISRGGAQPNISQTVIKNTEVPLIDENEQKSIVEFLTKIEKSKETNYSLIPKQLHKAIKLAFEHLDCLQKLENENLNQSSCLSLLRQSILQKAIEGKLTAKWREQHPDLISGDNHASKLLEKIKAEKERLTKNTKGAKNAKTLLPISEEEKPFDLPEGWVWCQPSDLGFFAGGGTPNTSVTDYWNGNIPWITPKDMKVDNIYNSELKITKKGIENSNAILLPANTLIFVVRSGILKRIIPISISRVESTINQDLKAWFLCMSEMADFLRINIKGHEARLLRSIVKKSMTVESFDFDKFKCFPIPLPPLAEQQAIVERVDKLMTMTDELEKQVSERKEQSEMLMQSVLGEAFVKG